DGRMDVTMVPAEQALEMTTLLGARALGLDSEIGSIEVGKKADLVLFDSRRAEWRALFDPVNNLAYSAGGRSVRTVVADVRLDATTAPTWARPSNTHHLTSRRSRR